MLRRHVASSGQSAAAGSSAAARGPWLHERASWVKITATKIGKAKRSRSDLRGCGAESLLRIDESTQGTKSKCPHLVRGLNCVVCGDFDGVRCHHGCTDPRASYRPSLALPRTQRRPRRRRPRQRQPRNPRQLSASALRNLRKPPVGRTLGPPERLRRSNSSSYLCGGSVATRRASKEV